MLRSSRVYWLRQNRSLGQVLVGLGRSTGSMPELLWTVLDGTRWPGDQFRCIWTVFSSSLISRTFCSSSQRLNENRLSHWLQCNSRIEEFIDLRNRWSCSPTAFFWIYRILNGWKKQWKIHIQTKFCSLMFETVDARLRLGFQSRSPEEPQESGTAWFEECSGGSQ